ncbi:MAG: CHRD domain-containing protein [Pseudomonadota bacterium]
MTQTLRALALALAAASAPAVAAEAVYHAVLTGSAEAPPNASPATGTAHVVFDFDTATLLVQADFSGLLAGSTNAHIHCCTAEAGTGTAGAATPVPTFPGFPSGVMAGSYEQSFDMLQASSYNPAFITANGGTVADAMNALLVGLNSGTAYFNIHSTQFPGGEIRGFLAPIPEPSTYGLMLAGLVALGAAAQRRRSAR